MPILAGEDYFSGPIDLISRLHPPSANAFARMEWMAYALGGFRNRLLDLAAPDTHVLIKNPLLWNIELFPTFFPNDRAILLIRDLRYIADSYSKHVFKKAPKQIVRGAFASSCPSLHENASTS